MIGLRVGDVFKNELTSIVQEELSDLQSANNRSIVVDGSLHVRSSRNGSVVRNGVVGVLSDDLTIRDIGSRIGGRLVTVEANLHGTAVRGGGVVGQVILAGVLGDLEGGGELEEGQWVPSVTASASLAVDDGLRGHGDQDVGVLSVDIDDVRESRGGSLNPAGATVNGASGVSGPGKSVGSVGESPVEGGWETGGVDVGPGEVLGSEGSVDGLVSDVAAGEVFRLVLSLGFFLGDLFLENREELVDLEMDEFFSVENFVGDGFLGHVQNGLEIRDGPVARLLDTHDILASEDLEEASEAPEGSPRVSSDPVLGTVFLSSVTNDRDEMVSVDFGLFADDAAGVAVQHGGVDTADDGSSLVNFVDHLLLADDGSVLDDGVDVIFIGRLAGLAGEAQAALDLSVAVGTVALASGSVVRACLVTDVVLVDVGVGGLSTSSMAAFAGAGDEDLRGDDDVGPLGLSHDLDTVGEGGGRGEGPASTAVDGDVLVSDDGQVIDAIHVSPVPGVGEGAERVNGYRVDDQIGDVVVFGDVTVLGESAKG